MIVCLCLTAARDRGRFVGNAAPAVKQRGGWVRGGALSPRGGDGAVCLRGRGRNLGARAETSGPGGSPVGAGGACGRSMRSLCCGVPLYDKTTCHYSVPGTIEGVPLLGEDGLMTRVAII